MKSIKIGLIGCGGRLQGLVREMRKVDAPLAFVALADPDKKAQDASREFLAKDALVTDDYHRVLADPAVEWVMIGSYNCQHREQVVAAFEAGKHVFCEKPLATTLEDCLAMRAAWKAARDRQFVMGFNLRYSPHYRKLKELVASGAIGRLVSMEFNETINFWHGCFIMGGWRRFTQYAGTHLLEKCCHDIDLVNWLVESPARWVASFGGINIFTPENANHLTWAASEPAKAIAENLVVPGVVNVHPFTCEKDIVDNQVAIIEFANGVRATFHANCAAGIPERRMYICGTTGSLRADVLKGEIELRPTGAGHEIRKIETGSIDGHGGGDQVLARELIDIMVDGRQPTTRLEDGLRAAITCFAIDEARTTKTVVNLDARWEASAE